MEALNDQAKLSSSTNSGQTAADESTSSDSGIATAMPRHVNRGLHCGTSANDTINSNAAPSLDPIDKSTKYEEPATLVKLSPIVSPEGYSSDKRHSPAQSLISDSSHDSQLINTTNKFTYTASISKSPGWNPINAPRSVDTACGELAQMTIGQEQIKDEHVCQESDVESLEDDEYKENVRTDIPIEYTPDSDLDEKYFDHYGYLNYINSQNLESGAVQNAIKASRLKSQNSARTRVKCKKRTQSYNRNFSKEGTTKVETETNFIDQVSDDSVTNETTQSNQAGHWVLFSGTIEPPQVGHVSPEKLTISLVYTPTNTRQTFKFPSNTLNYNEINWESRAHIDLITQWRASILTEHGISLKKVHKPYTDEENAWFDLFHAKIRAAIEAGAVIKIPGPIPILEAFNSFFAGSVSDDDIIGEGETHGVKEARSYVSIRCKLENKRSGLGEERVLLRSLIGNGRDGVVYVPVLDAKELAAYRRDGTVVVDDPLVEEKNAAFQSTRENKKRKVDGEECGDGGKDSKKGKVRRE